MYKLKPNAADFEVVDGPFAGRKYKDGQVYSEIPPEERLKFDELNPKPETRNPKQKGEEK